MDEEEDVMTQGPEVADPTNWPWAERPEGRAQRPALTAEQVIALRDASIAFAEAVRPLVAAYVDAARVLMEAVKPLLDAQTRDGYALAAPSDG